MQEQAVFVCAHGAGGHSDDRGMRRLAEALEPQGLEVVRFNFPYRERGSRRPDPMPLLKETIANVAQQAKDQYRGKKLLLGGRSMGGRAASMLAAEGFVCDALLLAAYPLHPAGKPEKLRDAHLPAISVPVLCFNGTRDALCRQDLMEKVLLGLNTSSSWTMHWLKDADHSFRVPKSSGRTEDEVYAEIGAAAARWLAALG